MAFAPVPLVPEDAPATPNSLFRPVPVSGVSDGSSEASEVTVESAPGIVGSDVQAVLEDLAARIVALETTNP